MNRLDGQAEPLSKYQGQVLMIVNVASKCGLTPQYEGLEKLYEKFRSRKFSILGFPANDTRDRHAIGNRHRAAGMIRIGMA